MKRSRFVLSVVSLTAIIVLAACNLPKSQGTGLSAEQLAATMVAQTAQAAPPTATFTAIPAASATAAPVTPTVPSVTVSVATNCRTGPNPNYPFVMLFQPGMTAQVVAKYTPSNYWIINMPNGGTCWLWGSYATVQGNVAGLQEATPPQLVMVQQPTLVPTSSSSQSSGNSSNQDSGNQSSGSSSSSSGSGLALSTVGPMVVVSTQIVLNPGILLIGPAAPTGVKAKSTCTSFRDDLITWNAVSNATGYILYANGSKLTKITSSQANCGGLCMYSRTPSNMSGAITYGVAAYNSYGTSSTVNATAPGCP